VLSADQEALVMTDMQVVEVQTYTQGAVPEEAVELAVQRVRSLLRLAPGRVLFVRVKLALAADPAVDRPATVQATIDAGGRVIRAQAAARTLREATGLLHDRLRIRMTHSRAWPARRRMARAPSLRDLAHS
jgi:hypothetical protein